MKKDKIIENAKKAGITVSDSLAGILLGVSPIEPAIDTYKKIKSDLLEEKIETFMISVGEISYSDKKKFLKVIDKEIGEFFKRLWIVLDRLEDKPKATIIGKLF